MSTKEKTEYFVQKARLIHNDKYDYGETVYVNSSVKLKIICSCGHQFYQLPHTHLQGKGCYWCGHRERVKKVSLTTNEFIQRAVNVHNGKYDYSKTCLTKSREKVIITCPKHGDFQCRIDQHLAGNGCPGCGVDSRLKIMTKTYEIFVSQARKIHQNKYDYSKVNYVNNKIKVCIVCPEHGDFYQSPDQHINNKNKCPICAEDLRGKENRLTTEEFITKAKKVHGNIYDYSKSVYVTSNQKLTIICQQHGEFRQKAGGHLSGNGCYQCGHTSRTELIKKTTEEFITEAAKIHNGMYDYSKVDYISNDKNVTIICPEHGEFRQKAAQHTLGRGCWKCKSSRGERLLISIFMKNNIKYLHQYSLPLYKKLRYDFFLPELNVLIEFQGQQHFKPIDYFGGHEGFIQTVRRDVFKQSLARTYRIPISYFTYEHLRKHKNNFEQFVLKVLEKKSKKCFLL